MGYCFLGGVWLFYNNSKLRAIRAPLLLLAKRVVWILRALLLRALNSSSRSDTFQLEIVPPLDFLLLAQEPIDVKTGLLPEQAQSIAESLGFSKPEQIEDVRQFRLKEKMPFFTHDCAVR